MWYDLSNLKGVKQMAKIFINTIVGAAENLSQLELLHILDKLDLEIDGIEVRGELFSTDYTKRKEEFEEIQKIAEKNNWELHISYPFELFDEDGIRAEAKTALTETTEQRMQSAKFNTGHLEGLSKTKPQDIEDLFASFIPEIRIENGQEIENGTIKYVQYALDQIEAQNLPIGFTFDMGNWSIMNKNPQEAFDLIESKITAFHLKNVNEEGEPVLVDEGLIKWRSFTHLDIPYIIEYPIFSDEIKNEVEKLREAFL